MLWQGLLWETSLLDPEEGIRFRGYSIPDCQVGCLRLWSGVTFWVDTVVHEQTLNIPRFAHPLLQQADV